MLPTFLTDRLLLRPRSMVDLESCLAMDRDPLVTRFIPCPWPGSWSDPEKHRAFVIARMERTYPNGLGYWSVLDRTKPNAFLGWVLLLPHQRAACEIEIGWRFTRANWGRGFATEAARPVLDHAFTTVGLEAVVADIDPRNRASLRVAEKLGLLIMGERIVEGVRAKHYRIEKGGGS